MGIFDVDKLLHTLKVVKELDREQQALHLLLIRASEDCQSVPADIDFFDPADDTVLKVIVHVEDINDNRPQFVKRQYCCSMMDSGPEFDVGILFQKSSPEV